MSYSRTLMSGTCGATGTDADSLSLVAAGSALRRGEPTSRRSVRRAVRREGRGVALVVGGSLKLSRLLGGRRSSLS